MTISEDFAVCPWCGREDDSWPIYYTEPEENDGTAGEKGEVAEAKL